MTGSNHNSSHNSVNTDHIDPHSLGPADDPVFLRAVEEYLALLDAGQAPDRREFVRRFPDFADPLDKCLAGLEAVHGATGSRKGGRPGAATPTLDPATIKSLGDFQIVREIGRGGMGIVYEATQLSLGRKVALKVLPFAATFDAKHLQRFRNEAQAAAQLHHTNIVPVFAVGCERGVHFYAMQLIEGQSLSYSIDQLRRREGMKGTPFSFVDHDATTKAEHAAPAVLAPTTAPVAVTNKETFSGALSTQHSTSRKDFFRSVARLFVQAAQGLDHAHQVGIVHRDIKPANLLIDARGNLWITDFGLVQFRGDAQLTRTGDLVGTLRYMSPEQAAGNRAIIDHRSDIYSLGATLYEMATLEPIFPDNDAGRLIKHIAHDDPIGPRHLDPTIPVELETIILKAVNKSPADRYATAQEMAADLQRFLDDQPILARRPSIVDRVRKWGRRHPGAVAAVLGFLVLCVVALAINNRMISAEENKTRAALEDARRHGEDAEHGFAQARSAVDALFQVAEQELTGPHQRTARKKVLQTALTFYQDLYTQRKDDPKFQADLATVQNQVRRILSDLTTLEGAQRLDLLAEASVHDDLGLSPEDRELAADFAERWTKERWDFFQRTRGDDQQQRKLAELIRAHEESLAGLLSEAQIQRLQQIVLQVKGMFAFDEPDVIAALKLTPAQRTKINEIHAELVDRLFEKGPKDGFDRMFDKRDKNPFDRPKDWGKGPPPPPPDGKGGPRKDDKGPDFRSREQAAHRAGVERALSVLSPEQRTRWTQLVGPPFTGSTRLSPFFTPMMQGGPMKMPPP